MAQYRISPAKVAGVVVDVSHLLNDKGLNHGEVLVGLAELIGRTIVECAVSMPQQQALIETAKKHIEDTVRIGAAQGRSNIIRV